MLDLMLMAALRELQIDAKDFQGFGVPTANRCSGAPAGYVRQGDEDVVG